MPQNIVIGTAAAETMDAADGITEGDDYIRALDGDDTIFGLGGNDWINGDQGADYIDGGADNDTAWYSFSASGVSVSLATGLGFGGDAEGDTLVNIENLGGSFHDDVLVGNGGVNWLRGGKGSDTLKGGGGADHLTGDPGDDLLVGGTGGDELSGGEGIDTAYYAESTDGVYVSLKDNVALYGDAAGDTLNSIESLTGSAHGDGLLGNDGYNVLNGLGGQDTLKGFGGNDELWGGAGDDTLLGGNGFDTLRGESGKDALDGGAGSDDLYGGSDADTFIWNLISDTSTQIIHVDMVLDFNAAEGDLISLSGIDSNVYALGNQAFTFIGDAAFSGTPGEVRYYHSGGSTYIAMQTGTEVDVEGVIRLPGIVTPEASWFVL